MKLGAGIGRLGCRSVCRVADKTYTQPTKKVRICYAAAHYTKYLPRSSGIRLPFVSYSLSRKIYIVRHCMSVCFRHWHCACPTADPHQFCFCNMYMYVACCTSWLHYRCVLQPIFRIVLRSYGACFSPTIRMAVCYTNIPAPGLRSYVCSCFVRIPSDGTCS